MKFFKSMLAFAMVFFVLIGTSPVQATEKVEFILNWIAGGDHAPYYFALQEGWYKDAGIDLVIQQGKGSSMSSQRTGIGKTQSAWPIWEQPWLPRVKGRISLRS